MVDGSQEDTTEDTKEETIETAKSSVKSKDGSDKQTTGKVLAIVLQHRQ